MSSTKIRHTAVALLTGCVFLATGVAASHSQVTDYSSGEAAHFLIFNFFLTPDPEPKAMAGDEPCSKG